MSYRIGYLIGSLSSTSINRTLAEVLIGLAPPQLDFVEIPIGELPLFSRDLEAEMPDAALAFKAAIASAEGLLIVSPEYNRSIPGALKNAIDWGSRPRGNNSFARKPTGIIGASTGAIGTAVMQSSMRSVLSFLDAPQLNSPEAYIRFTPEVFPGGGVVTDPSTREFLAHYMGEFAAFVERVLASGAPGHIGDASRS
jgi:chromate reductase